jgi:hypothetical protein
MGHGSLQVTSIYTHRVSEADRAAAQYLGQLRQVARGILSDLQDHLDGRLAEPTANPSTPPGPPRRPDDTTRRSCRSGEGSGAGHPSPGVLATRLARGPVAQLGHRCREVKRDGRLPRSRLTGTPARRRPPSVASLASSAALRAHRVTGLTRPVFGALTPTRVPTPATRVPSSTGSAVRPGDAPLGGSGAAAFLADLRPAPPPAAV